MLASRPEHFSLRLRIPWSHFPVAFKFTTPLVRPGFQPGQRLERDFDAIEAHQPFTAF